MSYGTTLRAALEALIAGESGSTRTMSASRFHRRSPDRPETPALDSSERAFEVVLEPGTLVHPHNTRDSHALYRHDLAVRVHYALTHAGGDLAEGLTEQHGPGTLDAIRDRAVTDVHDLVTLLTWGENTSGLSPAIVSLVSEGKPTMTVSPSRAVLEVPFALLVWAQNTTVGTYAP